MSLTQWWRDRNEPEDPVFYNIRVWCGEHEFAMPHVSPSRETAELYVATYYDRAEKEGDHFTNGEVAWAIEHMVTISREEYLTLVKRLPGSYL